MSTASRLHGGQTVRRSRRSSPDANARAAAQQRDVGARHYQAYAIQALYVCHKTALTAAWRPTAR
jgi:hypothetical protein